MLCINIKKIVGLVIVLSALMFYSMQMSAPIANAAMKSITVTPGKTYTGSIEGDFWKNTQITITNIGKYSLKFRPEYGTSGLWQEKLLLKGQSYSGTIKPRQKLRYSIVAAKSSNRVEAKVEISSGKFVDGR